MGIPMTTGASRCRKEVGLRYEFTVEGACVRGTEQSGRQRGQRAWSVSRCDSNERETRYEANERQFDPIKDFSLPRQRSTSGFCADLYSRPVAERSEHQGKQTTA